MQLVVLLIPLTVGIFVGMDAQKRGMNPIGWGLFVFLILIIGLPAYFITRKPLLEDQAKISDPEILDEFDDI
jgi:hypothetical protein